ncbi:MAG: hypothetical protein U0414_05895 [Polyangiaceae bacterium]
MVDYKWVPQDERREALGFDPTVSKEAQLVTPYGIVVGTIPNAKSLSSGADAPLVKIPLSLSGFPGWHQRFTKILKRNGDEKYELKWVTLPSDLLGAETLGELCTHLNATRKSEYPDYLYKATELSGELPRKDSAGKETGDPSYHKKMPQLFFDYWENTELRYKIITGGGFAWGMAPQMIPAGKGFQWKVLRLEPKPVKAPARLHDLKKEPDPNTSTQGVVNKVDEDNLKRELVELMSLVDATAVLLRGCQEELQRRSRVISQFNALHVMMQSCRAAADPADRSTCDDAIAALERILETAHKKLGEIELIDLLADAKADKPPAVDIADLDPRINEALATLGGYSMTAASEVASNIYRIKEKLFTKSSLHEACDIYFGTALDAKEYESDKVRGWLRRTIESLTGALVVLGCDPHDEAFIDEIWKKLADAPSEEAKVRADLKGESTVELMLSAVGYVAANKATAAQIGLTLVGNLAGPPSLSIALIELAAGLSLPGAAEEISNGVSAVRMLKMRDNILFSISKYSHFAEYDEFKAAVQAGDETKMFKLRESFVEAVSGAHQTTVPWKAFTNVLQCLGAAASVYKIWEKGGWDKEKNLVWNLVDYGNAGSTVLQLALGTLETVLTHLGRFKVYSKLFKKAGMALGYLGCVVGMVQGACDVAEGKASRDTTKILVGELEFFGSAIMMMGMATGNPGVSAFGLTLSLVAAGISIVHDLEPKTHNRTNRVAMNVLDGLGDHEFFWVIYGHIKEDYKSLRRLFDEQELPYAPRQGELLSPIVMESLRRAGFSERQVAKIMDSPAIAFDPAYADKPATLLYVPPAS